MQQHICSGFTVLPAAFFYLDMTASADAGNKNHRGRANLVHIYGTTVDPLTLTRVAIDYVHNNFIEIPPGERRYREVVDGVSDFEIVKFGKKFAVRMNAIQPVAQTGDKFSCLIQIYKVIAWPNELERLYLFKTDHEIGNSGEPNPLP